MVRQHLRCIKSVMNGTQADALLTIPQMNPVCSPFWEAVVGDELAEGVVETKIAVPRSYQWVQDGAR